MAARVVQRLASLCVVLLACLVVAGGARAQSLRETLHRAYLTNPSFLAQQRGVPSAEAGVDRARAGYFPRVSANADYGLSETTRHYPSSSSSRSSTRPGTLALDVTQTLFDGARTYNAVGQANHQLAAARQTLRDAEQTVLLDAVTAYLDVVRDQTIVKLERQSRASLAEQLRLIRELHAFGDVTMTDVVQVQARVADSQARVSAAEAALKGSEAIFEQVIGTKPVNLSIPRPADRLVPSNLESAMSAALVSHPGTLAALASADAADSQVRVVTGEFSPTVSLTGSVTQQHNAEIKGDRRLNGSVVGRLSVPIFSGGETSARMREAQEIARRRRMEADAARTQVRAGIIRAWSQYQSGKVRLAAAQEQVRAASLALKGVREEFGLGQRTATNVLDAVQDLLSASINLAGAQRERVLTSYSVSRALGKLSLAGIEAGAQGSSQMIVDRFAQLSLPFRRSADLARWTLRGSDQDFPPPRAPFTARAPATGMMIRSTFQ